MSTNEELPAGLQPAPAVDPATGNPVQSNGHGPTLSAAQQTAMATQQTVQAIGALINQVMGLQQLIAQTAVPRLFCAQCFSQRIQWETTNAAALKTAIAAARQAAGFPDEAPTPPGFDPTPFLPENLRPGGSNGMPIVNFKVTAVGGTDCCAVHIPGAPTGKPPLLIAHGSLTPSMLGQLGG